MRSPRPPRPRSTPSTRGSPYARARLSQASWLVSPRTCASACRSTSSPKLAGTPAEAGGRWHLADQCGATVPLLGQDSLWPLLAVSGGHPVTMAGEWSPAGLTPLTVWHGNRAVPL